MNSRSNILIIASYPNSIIPFRGKFIVDLLNRGFEVHVAAPGIKKNEEVRSALEKLHVIVHDISLQRTGMNPVIDVITLCSIYKLMRSIKPNYSLCYTVKPVIYGSIAGWLARVPHRFAMITGLGYAFTGSGRSVTRNIIHRLYSFALARVDKVFFQNPDDANLFKDLGITKPHTRVMVVNGSGVDIEEYKKTPLSTEPHFLLIARLLGDKGVREYAEAARIMKEKYPQTVCNLVGWTDENPDAIEQHEVEQWSANGCIQFLGRLDDVRESIAASNIFVLPSYREGTPRTVLEAMAMGRPIITTDVPGCRETVKDGKNGYLVTAKSVDELITAMVKFVENPDSIQRMGNQSRLIIETKYDVRKVNKIMLNEMGITI
jgi:glycosyltransferase involved in cell wall biosynthesis